MTGGTSGGDAPLDPGGFADATGVSRETLTRLSTYADLLCKWQGAYNLVGPSTLGDLWRRHMLDSAQLAPLLPGARPRILDLGSGAGFPGLVLALLGAGQVTLVEANAKKAAFLRRAAQVTGTSVAVEPRRLEDVESAPFDVITARAVAPVGEILALTTRFAHADTIWLLLKGRDADRELTAALRNWNMAVERLPSQTEAAATVLRLSQVTRRAGGGVDGGTRAAPGGATGKAAG